MATLAGHPTENMRRGLGKITVTSCACLLACVLHREVADLLDGVSPIEPRLTEGIRDDLTAERKETNDQRSERENQPWHLRRHANMVGLSEGARHDIGHRWGISPTCAPDGGGFGPDLASSQYAGMTAVIAEKRASCKHTVGPRPMKLGADEKAARFEMPADRPKERTASNGRNNGRESNGENKMITRFPTLPTFRDAERIERMFRDLWPEIETSRWVHQPSVDIQENEKEIAFHVDLPGVEDKDIEVEVVGDTLSIHAKRGMEKEEKREAYVRMERSYGTYQRNFTLNFPIKPESVKAAYERGVLRIVVPKAEGDKSHRVPVILARD